METKDYISLEEAKSVAVSILNEFDAFCKKYGLQYWLSDGTLLGAIRHEGFIPWDDDIDVCMPTKDYMKFLELIRCGMLVADHIDIVAYELQAEYYRPWARAYDNRTELIDGQGMHLGQRCDMGLYPFIDIFPLVGFSDKRWKRNVQTTRLTVKMRMLSLVSGPAHIQGRALIRLLKVAIRPFARLLGQKRIMKSIQREYSLASRDTFSNPLVSIIYDNIDFFIPSQLYSQTGMVKFEQGVYPAPSHYEEVLRLEYGNYMLLPPEADRHVEYQTIARWKVDPKK